jgi:uncharacterized membrane protein YphA (DoxX/SURF4 family)
MTSYDNGGALLFGKILVALFFIIDGSYKTSTQAWPGYRDFIYEKFNLLGLQHEKLGYGGFGDVSAVILVIWEILGAVLLLMGFRSLGAGLLVFYLIPMSILSHTFVLAKGIDMTQFLPFLQGMALVGSLIVIGAYPDNRKQLPVRVENTRDVQRDANRVDFKENELPEYQKRTGMYRRR